MPQPAWRLLVEKKQIPGPKAAQWTNVLDYLTPGKLIKIVVVDQSGSADPDKAPKWKPKGFSDSGCTADGDAEKKQNQDGMGDPLLKNAPRGALIGRIGGSTADQTLEDPIPTTGATRTFFAVGRFCVFSVPSTPLGALYLGVNDAADRMCALEGNIYVTIYESL
jgi:hypothetical protein